MLLNATIIRIDTLSAPAVDGSRSVIAGTSINVRCCLDSVTFAARRTLGATIEEATGTVYVPIAAMAEPARLSRLVTRRTGELTSETHEVIHVVRAEKIGMGQWEMFVKQI